jgi:hypothetical protein
MGLGSGVFNTFILISLLQDYRGALRNLIFILLFWLLSFYFGSYLFEQADKFYNNPSADPNPFFGYFLISILLFDFLAYFIKARTIKYHVYKNKEAFLGRMGCLSIMESLLIGISILCNLLPGIWMMNIIFHALPPGNFIFPCTVLLVLTKWGVICYQCLFMTPNVANKWDDAPPQAPPKILDHLADVILTITTTVFFTVIWQVGINRFLMWYHPFDFKRDIYNTVGWACLYILLLPFFCIALYMPTRLIFIMEDYYALTNPKHRRAAFLSSVFAVAVSVAVAIFKSY